MAEMNPLQILGMVNQFQKAPTPNKALDDLRIKSSIMSQQQSGANARNLNTIANAARMNALPQGIQLSPETARGGSYTPREIQGLEEIRQGIRIKDLARGKDSGLHPFFPKDDLGNFVAQSPADLIRGKIIPGDTKGTAQAKAKSAASTEAGESSEVQDITIGGRPGLVQRRKRTESSKDQFKRQNDPTTTRRAEKALTAREELTPKRKKQALALTPGAVAVRKGLVAGQVIFTMKDGTEVTKAINIKQ